MFHQVTIAGSLGSDPELRYMPTGTGVANLSVAANHTYRNSNGETVKKTIWFRVSVFGKMAESVNQYLRKGSKVLIVGRLNPDDKGNPKTFTRQDGSAGASYELIAETVKFMDSRQNEGDSQPEHMGGVSDDDVPF